MTVTPVLYMDAELRPHRSLSRRGLWILLGGVAAYNAVLAGFMIAIGAFPVPIFLGADVLGVFIAFTVSARRAQTGERVQVTHDEVRVIREAGRGSRTLWRSPTAFTRVEVDRTADGVARVSVRLYGRSLSVGAMLGPSELASLEKTLTGAIRNALAERHP